MMYSELVQAAERLLDDIDSMQTTVDGDCCWYGEFVEYWHPSDDSVSVEWPNLRISAEQLRAAVEKVKG